MVQGLDDVNLTSAERRLFLSHILGTPAQCMNVITANLKNMTSGSFRCHISASSETDNHDNPSHTVIRVDGKVEFLAKADSSISSK
ncbi:hypothetical protein RRG08_058891 [Elysia crispata]|uniref:Uncharacterized protein n=1 Tax=Elysia crispata TaxID=231223 RepID=A0AAE1CPY0_9GAST|nr:hypothetical protein RRG08_058891 [Elysia crispata]